MTGDALLDFVDNQLIPTLGNLPAALRKTRAPMCCAACLTTPTTT